MLFVLTRDYADCEPQEDVEKYVIANNEHEARSIANKDCAATHGFEGEIWNDSDKVKCISIDVDRKPRMLTKHTFC